MVEERRGWKGRERPGVKTTPGRHSASAASCRSGGTRAPLLGPLLWGLCLSQTRDRGPSAASSSGAGGTDQTVLSGAGCPRTETESPPRGVGQQTSHPSPLTTPCSMVTS